MSSPQGASTYWCSYYSEESQSRHSKQMQSLKCQIEGNYFLEAACYAL